jgi:hypothetical protein
MPDDITTAILAAEQGRAAAMLANDTAALDRLLDPRLCFSHATGQVDDKAAYMVKMAAGRIDYLSIDWSEQQITQLGEANAVLTGRMTSQVRVEGVEKRLDNRVMAIWSLDNGDWRMLAFQSTPLKA